jgi:PadR family transcriptional regulator AphA
MENVVLGLLILRNLTLYELNQAFKQGISMFYSASYGSLQVAVKSLLNKGMVIFEERVDNGRNKKIYSITEIGRAAFYQWMLVEIPPNKLEVTALSKVFFLGLVLDPAQKKQIVLEILNKIQMVQADLKKTNDEINRLEIPASFQGIFKYQAKTLEYGLQMHILAREWFQTLLKDLDEPV